MNNTTVLARNICDHHLILVLQFYGLDSLTPTEWTERQRGSVDGAIANLTAIQGESSTEEILSRLAALDNARQLLRDDCDPLDLKESSWLRQVQMTRTGPTRETSAMASLSASMEDTRSMLEAPSNSIIITEENFDARAFLREVHGDTSFADLVRGQRNLLQATEQRNLSLKNLVKQNFDRFVNAKNATEVVYKDMQSKRLTDSDHGMRRAVEALSASQQKSMDVYGMLIHRREQELLIRKRLDVFSKYSFIFSLGYRLEQSMKLGEYQVAVADYRKARAMMQAVTSKSLQTILQKIWSGHVDIALSALRADLFAKLSNTVFTYDVHSKLIDFLLALDAHPDPVFFYFSSRMADLTQQMNAFLQHSITELQNITSDIDAAAVPRVILSLVSKRQTGKLSALQVDIVRCWKIRSSFTYSTVEIFKSFFGEFGRFIWALLAGRFSRDQAVLGSLQSEKVKELGTMLANEWPKSLQQVLASDLMVEADIQESSAVSIYYSIRGAILFCEMLDFVREAKCPDFFFSFVTLTVERCIAVLLSAVWNCADEDCALLPQLETWQCSGEGFDYSTVLVKGFEGLLIYLIEGSATVIGTLLKAVDNQLAEDPVRDLDMRLAEAICSFLTELNLLVSGGTAKTDPDDIVAMIDSAKGQQTLDDLGMAYKQLITITNLQYLRNIGIPRIFSSFSESGLGEISAAASEQVTQMLDTMEGHVRRLYLDSKRSRLLALIRMGIVQGSASWREGQILRIRPYVFALLLELVSVQTEIYDVSTTILRPIMSALVMDMISEFLRCVQILRSMEIGAYLQLCAEAALLQAKMISAMSEEALEVYYSLMATLDATCDQVDLQADSENSKKLIDEAVREADASTRTVFACFQYS